MDDKLADCSTTDALRAEVARLRGEVGRLQDQVRQLDALANLDSLIDLPNRRGFMRQLDGLVARVQRYGERAAMLYVDVDGLKTINDSFGHPAGDEALIRVAELLVSGVRKGDCVGRLGGDEFGILLAHADERTAEDAARRLIDRIADCALDRGGESLPLSVAIGAAVIERDDTPEAVLARADAAMYVKKAAA